MVHTCWYRYGIDHLAIYTKGLHLFQPNFQVKKISINKIVGSQIVAHTQMETGDGPNKPNTINL